MIKVPIYQTRNKAVELAEPGDNLFVDGPAGTTRGVQFRTDGENRIYIGTDSVAETGANAGSNFIIVMGDDNGNLLNVPLTINRATGTATFSTRPEFGANTPWDEGNLPVVDGTWTPTLTGVANVTALTAFLCYYQRIGNSVSFWGRFDVDPTATATLTTIGISLPVASNFGVNVEAVGGCMSQGATSFNTGFIIADTVNNRLEARLISNGTVNVTFAFNGSYRII